MCQLILLVSPLRCCSLTLPNARKSVQQPLRNANAVRPRSTRTTRASVSGARKERGVMQHRRKQGDLAYGVQYRKQGEHLLSHILCWRKKKEGAPPEWEQLKKDAQIVRDRLFKSGRMIDSF